MRLPTMSLLLQLEGESMSYLSPREDKKKKEAGIKINRTKKRNEKGKLKVPIKNEQPSHPVFLNEHAIIHGYINRVLLKK